MNKKLSELLVALAALLLATATALGAVASHALGHSLSADALASFETGVDYQFVHALGLLAVATYGRQRADAPLLSVAALLLLVGIALFCGGVYASSLDGPRWIAQLAPTGGISLILGWLAVVAGALRSLAAATRSD